MTYIITDKCIFCGSCAPFCVEGAIIEGDHFYYIDQDKCDCCGTCLEYCPIDDAIVEVFERASIKS